MPNQTQRAMHIAGAWCPHLLLLGLMIGLLKPDHGTWSAIAILYLFVPLADRVMGPDLLNFDEEQFTPLQHTVMAASPFAFIFGYVALLLLYLANFSGLSLIAQAGAVLSLGATGSVVLVACHELIHKRSKTALWTARLGLAAIGYGHFEYFHLQGHHPRSGTERDVHTARPNESVYRFLSRTITQAITLSIQLEERNARREQRAFWSVRSKVIYFLAAPITLTLIFYLLWGTRVFPSKNDKSLETLRQESLSRGYYFF